MRGSASRQANRQRRSTGRNRSPGGGDRLASTPTAHVSHVRSRLLPVGDPPSNPIKRVADHDDRSISITLGRQDNNVPCYALSAIAVRVAAAALAVCIVHPVPDD